MSATRWLVILMVGGGVLAWGLSQTGSVTTMADARDDTLTVSREAETPNLSDARGHENPSIDCGWPNYGFGKKVAGTYLITFWFTECVEWIDGPGGEEGVYEPEYDECTQEVYNTAGSGIVTIHSDGTLLFWSENAYGVFGAPPDCDTAGCRRHDSPAIGVWKRTGRHTIKCNNLIIGKYEVDASNAFIVRQNMEITFSEGFTHLDIDLPIQLVFPAGEDLDGDGVDDNYECLFWTGELGSEAPDPNSQDCAWINVYAGAAVGTRFQVLD